MAAMVVFYAIFHPEKSVVSMPKKATTDLEDHHRTCKLVSNSPPFISHETAISHRIHGTGIFTYMNG